MEAATTVIHFVHFSSIPGGIEVLLPTIINELNDYEIRVFVIRPSKENSLNVYSESKLSITYGSEINFVAYYKLWIYALKNRKHIFHVYNIGPIFLLILKIAGCTNILYSLHGTIYWRNKRKKFLLKLIWAIALSPKQVFTSNSLFSANMFNERINADQKILLLYNPIDSKVFYRKERINNEENKLKVIYTGRLTQGKNLYRWLDIASVLVKELSKNILFEIYGNGPIKNDLIQYSMKLGVSEFVSFKGHVSNIGEIYRNANLLIFLSEYESFGNVVVECILCGTPVIASDIPSMREIFQNYSEFLVALDENLEQNVLKKVENLEDLITLVPKAREEFIDRFSLEQHIQKLQQIYNSFNN